MGLIKENAAFLLENNMEEYYKEILAHRAIPDIRDGLMEVQRRTLFGAYDIGAYSSKAYTKSVNIVAAGLTRHPHGDSALYNAAVNMAQYWKNPILLLDKNGSVGSPYGDTPAAMRYLEMRLHKNSENYLLDGLKTECVDFKKTFDDIGFEPAVLPAKLPFYFINGAFGISGGYSVNVPPHNPKEVIEETIKYIKDPNYKIHLRPDIPTGGIILDDNNLEKAYTTGRSNFIMRAKVEKDEKHHKLIVTELPYMVTLNNLNKQLKEVTQKTKDNKKKEVPPLVPGISSIDNNSAQGDVELHINVKNGYSLDQVEKLLYQNTSMQVTCPFILVGVEGEDFKVYNNINEIMDVWLKFRMNTVKRMKFHYIKQWNYRIHIIDGLLVILNPKLIKDVLDKIMKLSGKQAVIEMLQEDYNLTSKQAIAVAEIPLYKISKLSINELKDEKKDLKSKLDDNIEYLKNPELVKEYIINELEEINSKLKYERKSTLSKKFSSLDLDNAEDIPDKEYSIIITSQGYIKKRPPIKSQKRNGKGFTLGKVKDGDYPVISGNVNERDFLYIFTNAGKVYKFEVRDFQETGTNLGISIKGRVNNERITSCLTIPRDINESDYNILIVTKLNKIKQTPLEEYKNISTSGIIATKLIDNDEVVSAILINKNEESKILISNSSGNTLLIGSNDVPEIKRTTIGSMAFSNDMDGEVVSVDYMRDYYTHVLVITDNGLGKLVEIEEFYSRDRDDNLSLQKRGQKGMMASKLKDNKLVACKFCSTDEQVTIVSLKNMISIPISDISVYKRTTFGCKLMNLDEGDKVIEINIP